MPAALGSKLSKLIRSRHSSVSSSNTQENEPETPTPTEDEAPALPEVHEPGILESAAVISKIASSSELFGLFKALAAGKNSRSPNKHGDEVDSDEDEDTGLDLPNINEHEILNHTSATHGQDDSEASTSSDDDTLITQLEPKIQSVPSGKDHHRAALKRWYSNVVVNQEEQEAASTKLAALSLSNISPLADGAATPSTTETPGPTPRPGLNRLISKPDITSEHEDDEEDFADPEIGTRSVSSLHPSLPKIDTSFGSPSPSADSTLYNGETPFSAVGSGLGDFMAGTEWAGEGPKIPDQQKLDAIIEEFGPVAEKMEYLDGSPCEPERLLAEAHGSLFKGVMMLGNLHLTSHRLLFHAVLPPDSAYHVTRNSADGSLTTVEVLTSGPITLHRGGIATSRRVWAELSQEMMTTYPSADEAGRTRPLRSVLLSTVRRMKPLDPDHPKDFHLTFDSPHGEKTSHFSVDTEQVAIQWRRSLEGALFRYARMKWRENEAKREGLATSGKDDWNMMRVCIPLDRITVLGAQSYHTFATLLAMEIELDDVKDVTFNPEAIAEGDYTGIQSVSRRGSRRSSPAPSPLAHSPALTPSVPAPTATPAPAPASVAMTPTGSQDRPQPHPAAPAQASPTATATPTGTHTPTRSFSLKSPLGSLRSPNSRESSPSRKSSLSAKPIQWMDTTVPSMMTKGTALSADNNISAEEYKMDEWAHEYGFNVAVLNEQAWFVQSLEAAIADEAKRRYKSGITRPSMVMNVAGHNCLVQHDDEPLPPSLERTETMSSIEDVADLPSPIMEKAKTILKAEKASMAAKVFALNEEEGIWLKRCFLARGVVPARGHIIVTPQYVCFWRRAAVGADIKYRFKTKDIKGTVANDTTCRAGFHGLALQINGHHDLKFEFWDVHSREEVVQHIQTVMAVEHMSPSSAASMQSHLAPLSPTDSHSSLSPLSSTSRDPPMTLDEIFQQPLKEWHDAPHAADILAPPKEALFSPKAFPDDAIGKMPFVANSPWQTRAKLRPRTFAMLTIGSRGDVQPYIALGIRLIKDGHKVVLITHDEFKNWIEGYGIEHRQAGGDPTALMKLSAEHKIFSPGFFKESLGSFRQWLDDLLLDSWRACHDVDVLIESPSTMSGIHIAEALKIPYFRAFTMPWTRTSAYPHAFMVPAFEIGPQFNYSTYVLFDNIIWTATSGQINRWRKEHLGLKSTDMSTLSITKVPFLYNFSSAIVPKPLDWHDDITITGYWNLENSDTDWTPPAALEAFMTKAKDDGKALVYIGFGSIVVPRPNAMTKSIIKAVEKAGVRAIIAKGWSSRGGDPAKEGEQIQFPESCYGLDKVPHSWLFPKVQAALHHGGAGTVGASLRAGVPTLIKPWFGDQFFWANRVTKLEVGVRVSSLRSADIADALVKATTSRIMIEKAARIGELIRKEDGVENAVNAIQYNIIRAASDRRKMKYA